MSRLDIARIRKDHGMSQGELAQQLQITQSFLSAIENGKSPLPPEKESRILEIFSLDDPSIYMTETPSQAETGPRPLEDMSEGDLIGQLLNRFHEQAHRKDGMTAHHHEHHDRIAALEEANAALLRHIDSLLERNDRLAADNDALRRRADHLQEEIFRLKTNIRP